MGGEEEDGEDLGDSVHSGEERERCGRIGWGEEKRIEWGGERRIEWEGEKEEEVRIG